jgi:predicted transcriptional regulator
VSGSSLSFRIDDRTKAALDEEASREDRSVSYIAQRAIADYLDRRAFRREQIMAAYALAESEQAFVSDEAMLRWVDSWGGENELPAPEPDVLLKR